MSGIIIEMENFKCYDSRKFELNSGVTLITGGSGIGKSTFMEAIYYVLYNKTKKHIMFGKKSCWVKLTLTDGVWIKRHSGSHELQVGIDNDIYKDTVAQQVIENLYGKAHEFLATCYMRQDEKHPLLTGTNEEKMELIRSLSLTEDVTTVKTRLADELKKIQDSVTLTINECDKAVSVLTEFDNNNNELIKFMTEPNAEDLAKIDIEQQKQIHVDALARLELIKPELLRIQQLEANLKALRQMNIEEITEEMVKKSNDTLFALENEKLSIKTKLNMYAEFKIKEAAIKAAKEQAERVRKEFEEKVKQRELLQAKLAAEKLAQAEQRAKKLATERAAKIAEREAARNAAIEKKANERRQVLEEQVRQANLKAQESNAKIQAANAKAIAAKAEMEQAKVRIEHQRMQMQNMKNEKIAEVTNLQAQCDALIKDIAVIGVNTNSEKSDALENEINRISKNKTHLDNIENNLKQFAVNGNVMKDVSELIKRIEEVTKEISETNSLITELEVSLLNIKTNEENSRLLVCPKCSAGLRTEDHKLHLVKDNFKAELRPVTIPDATESRLNEVRGNVIKLNDLKERMLASQKTIGQEKLMMGRFVPSDIDKLAKAKQLQTLLQNHINAKKEVEKFGTNDISDTNTTNDTSDNTTNTTTNNQDVTESTESLEIVEIASVEEIKMPEFSMEDIKAELLKEFPPLEDDNLTQDVTVEELVVPEPILVELIPEPQIEEINIELPILPNESENELNARTIDIEKEKKQHETIITKRGIYQKYQVDLNNATNALDDKSSEKIQEDINTCEKISRKALKLADLTVRYLRRHDLQKIVDNLKPEISRLTKRAETISKLKEKAKQVENTVLYNTVVSLNLEMKRFLDVLFADDQISVEFKTTKQLKTKNTTSMTCSMNIFYKNNQLDDYKTLSGGEVSRISLALMLAMNSLRGSNLILLDESLSTINESLKMNVIDLLKTVVKDDKICALILHSSVQGVYDHVISL